LQGKRCSGHTFSSALVRAMMLISESEIGLCLSLTIYLSRRPGPFIGWK
jgi:hypothetical protein